MGVTLDIYRGGLKKTKMRISCVNSEHLCFPNLNKVMRAPLEIRIPKNSDESSKGLACNVCGKRFAVAARLRRHEASHSGVRPFKCPLCEYTSNRSLIQQLKPLFSYVVSF